LEHLISSWIDRKNDSYDESNIPYKFKLILCGSQDGFSRTVFENKCYNIEQTVIIIKIKETGQLVGGYNQVGWNIKEKPLRRKYWIKTDESFIFKINQDQINDSTLSRVKDPRSEERHVGKKIKTSHDDIKFKETKIK